MFQAERCAAAAQLSRSIPMHHIQPFNLRTWVRCIYMAAAPCQPSPPWPRFGQEAGPECQPAPHRTVIQLAHLDKTEPDTDPGISAAEWVECCLPTEIELRQHDRIEEHERTAASPIPEVAPVTSTTRPSCAAAAAAAAAARVLSTFLKHAVHES